MAQVRVAEGRPSVVPNGCGPQRRAGHRFRALPLSGRRGRLRALLQAGWGQIPPPSAAEGDRPAHGRERHPDHRPRPTRERRPSWSPPQNSSACRCAGDAPAWPGRRCRAHGRAGQAVAAAGHMRARTATSAADNQFSYSSMGRGQLLAGAGPRRGGSAVGGPQRLWSPTPCRAQTPRATSIRTSR